MEKNAAKRPMYMLMSSFASLAFGPSDVDAAPGADDEFCRDISDRLLDLE